MEKFYGELKELNQKIVDLLLDSDVEEAKLTAEMNGAEEYYEGNITIMRIVNEKLKVVNQMKINQ